MPRNNFTGSVDSQPSFRPEQPPSRPTVSLRRSPRNLMSSGLIRPNNRYNIEVVPPPLLVPLTDDHNWPLHRRLTTSSDIPTIEIVQSSISPDTRAQPVSLPFLTSEVGNDGTEVHADSSTPSLAPEVRQSSPNLEVAGSGDEESVQGFDTVDDFLENFIFNNDEVQPSGCHDLNKAIYGFSEDEHSPPRPFRLLSRRIPQTPEVDIHIDVDSVLWNMRDLPLEEPITVYPDPLQARNISSNHQHVWNPAQGRSVPMNRTPHCLFGKTERDVAVYVIFPSLAPSHIPAGQDYLNGHLLDRWYDQVVFPAINQSISPLRAQHIRPTRKNMVGFEGRSMVGHHFTAAEGRRITQSMRAIVESDSALEEKFCGYFFHAMIKGIKAKTSIPMVILEDNEERKRWLKDVVGPYTDVFGEEGHKRMQVDLAAEVIPSLSSMEESGPVSLLWRKEATGEIRMGMSPIPKMYEWWLSGDIAGTTVDLGPESLVNVNAEPPSVTYFQTYHVDKEFISGKKDHWMGKLKGEDMTWMRGRMRESFQMIMEGIQLGVKIPWGARAELRMASRELFGSSAFGGLLELCSRIKESPDAYFRALPTLQAARFKAANFWIVRDGVLRADGQPAPRDDLEARERKNFCELLAGLYRGLYRGMHFVINRSPIFGSPTCNEDRSFHLYRSLLESGRPFHQRHKVTWTGSRASAQGLLSSFADLERQQMNGVLGQGGVRQEAMIPVAVASCSEIAVRIMDLLREDMITATARFQTSGTILSWSLEEIQRTIPRRRESSIRARKTIRTWRGIFEYLFPRMDDDLTFYHNPPRWRRVKYLKEYLAECNRLDWRNPLAPTAAHKALYEELWRLFRELDCVVRPILRDRFAEARGGFIFIDLPH
ncbi:hypothetical protein BJ684DRAFT_14744 [Piptocephalis cylindrospora]|uniref:Uncharacterized protein n=1 Tax=Piptocephalis cylindrospora TaxID=1907219 RepID=A0A4P9Y7F1_9FUNG|nr:hypothetical protein BJ684DRAFT_14744 [Piptocephalis cylindrospora]|eukprot:RKP14965.1 hypothetical protein BJ684DRAFT_14744 [Piptocephalis cylindrospora]